MPDPQPAQRLVAGRYRLESVLGRGGMGVVWRATDELIGRVVAVKEVRAPAGLTGEERLLFGERALREARTAGQINHPAVVAIHDLVPASGDDEAVYIVTELVDAPTLADLLNQGPLPPARVTAFAVRMLDALDAAHSVGVVHRDVKPGNIMVLPGDAVKLLDFGIAQAAGDARLTRHGMMGSTGYLAPELFHGSDPTPAADLWSAGVTLAQAVTGELPFERASTAATLHAVLYDDIPAMTCGEPLATVINGLLTRDVAQRLTLQRARDLLAVPVEAGATGRRDNTASAAAADPDPPASDGVETDAEPGESWERQATTVHPDRSTPPRQRQSTASAPQSTGAQATTFLVEMPGKTEGPLTLARLVLVVLTIWAVVLFVGVVTASALPEWLPIPAALTALVVAGWTLAEALEDSWHGTLRFGSDSLRFQGSRGSPPDLSWTHVASIAVWPGAGSPTGTSRLGIELSARAPTPAPAHGRVFQGPPERGRGPMWLVGDIGVGPKTMAARLGALVPDHVPIDQSREVPGWAARAFQPLGPRRSGVLLRFVLFAGLILCGHLFLHQRNSTMVTLADDDVSAVAFSPDGATLASADAGTFAITFWDVATRKTAAIVAGHREEVTAFAFSPDGKTLASGGRDGVIKLWDVANHQVRATLVFDENDTVTRVLFSPGGDSIAAVGYGDVKLWPMALLGKPMDLSAGEMKVQTIRFTADGRVLVGLDGQGGVRAWETASGRSAARINGPIAPWVDFRSDGQTLIRASGSGAVVATLDGGSHPPDSAAFGPGDLFVTAERGDVRIWHTTTARTAYRYKQGFLDSDALPSEAVAMAPRGEIVALGGDEGLRLWTYGSAG
ncbi:WD40 repeat domain-containing serine/threonine protein kinase [Micromonospora sp. NPDC047557]|uniref:WD40 repeat domain-containing serine/threonine protein kinase n=1 Tax=Micromonospora sp. NPDC047557 TaxID=3364250 RepID=UPI0037193FAB